MSEKITDNEKDKKTIDTYFEKAANLRKRITSYEKAESVCAAIEKDEEGSSREFAGIWAMIMLADHDTLESVGTYIQNISHDRPKEFIKGLQEVYEKQKEAMDNKKFEEAVVLPYLNHPDHKEMLEDFKSDDPAKKWSVLDTYFNSQLQQLRLDKEAMESELAKETDASKKDQLQQAIKKNSDIRESVWQTRARYEKSLTKKKPAPRKVVREEKTKKDEPASTISPKKEVAPTTKKPDDKKIGFVMPTPTSETKDAAFEKERAEFDNHLLSFYNEIEDEKTRWQHKKDILKKLGIFNILLQKSKGATTSEEELDAGFESYISTIELPKHITQKVDTMRPEGVTKVDQPVSLDKDKTLEETFIKNEDGEFDVRAPHIMAERNRMKVEHEKAVDAINDSSATDDEKITSIRELEDTYQKQQSAFKDNVAALFLQQIKPGDTFIHDLRTQYTFEKMDGDDIIAKRKDGSTWKLSRKDLARGFGSEEIKGDDISSSRATAPTRTTGTFPAGGFRSPGSLDSVDLKEGRASEEERLNNRFVGKSLILEVSGERVAHRINNVEEIASDQIIVTASPSYGKGETKQVTFDSLDSLKESVRRFEKRGETLERFTANFTAGLTTDLEDMGALKKTWLQIKKSLGGQKIETGLSTESHENLNVLDNYLDELLDTARKKWQDLGYPPEKVSELLARYKARYMSTAQLRSEYMVLEKQKDEGVSNTWIGRKTKEINTWWKKLPPSVRAGVGVTVTAGLTAFSVYSGTALTTRAASMAGGMLLGGVARGGLAAIWKNSENADKFHKELESKQRTYKETVKKIQALINDGRYEHDPIKKLELEKDREVLTNQLAELQQEFKTIKEKIDEAGGQITKDRQELEDAYNYHEISASEYLREDKELRRLEVVANNFKKIVGIMAAVGGAGLGAELATSGLSLGDLNPFDSDTNETISQENTSVEEPAPVENNKTVPEPEQPEVVEDVQEQPEAKKESETTADTSQDKNILHDADRSTVKSGQGITHAFKAQFDADQNLVKAYEQKLDMDYEGNKPLFLKKLAEEFGYIDKSGNQILVAEPGSTAYQLNLDGTVSEFDHGTFHESHSFGDAFEKPTIDNYEYTATLADETPTETATSGSGVGPTGEQAVGPLPDGSARTSVDASPKFSGENSVGPLPDGSARLDPTQALANPTETNPALEDFAGISESQFETTVDKLAGSETSITRDNFLRQFFELQKDGHWILPGTDIHFSTDVAATETFSTIDGATETIEIPSEYNPDQNIANLKSEEWFNNMNNGNVGANGLAQTLQIENSKAEILLKSLRQIQMLAVNLDINIPADETIAQTLQKVATKISK